MQITGHKGTWHITNISRMHAYDEMNAIFLFGLIREKSIIPYLKHNKVT